MLSAMVSGVGGCAFSGGTSLRVEENLVSGDVLLNERSDDEIRWLLWVKVACVGR